MMLPSTALHLTSTWFIRPGCESEVDETLPKLVAEVEETEPDTLVYMAHRPLPNSPRLQSLPPADPNTVVFFEVYRDVEAFQRHLEGAAFNGFVARHGAAFVAANGKPLTFVEFLHLQQGFIRSPAAPRAPASNRHPAVMFEILANNQGSLLDFYRKVFGWNYQEGTGGFAYVKFPVETLPLLGGIGQANDKQPGWEAGRHFYLRVDDLKDAIERVKAAGGKAFVPPVSVDGYNFAMVKDPEGNVIGLIEPFQP